MYLQTSLTITTPALLEIHPVSFPLSTIKYSKRAPYPPISALDSRTRHRHDLSVSAKTPSQPPIPPRKNIMQKLLER